MTIYRGPGGGGNADSDAEIDALTLLSTQTLAYSEAAGLEADAAALSAAAASTSAASAATSASGAATSATNAAASASSASTSASSASTSATNATASASSASTSATNAASSASAASTSATNAAASETNAATSVASALTYSTASAASAVTASTQAGNAATSASAAAGSATNAATSATNAATSASGAATSATNASNSASAASASAANALASETAAAASVASIDLPTIVRTTGNQTIGGTKTFSSTIVGSVNGNAATVTTNANLTGDVTSVGNATTLSNTAVTAGSYTLSNITVDAKGRITAASSGSPSGGVSSFSAGTTGFTPSTATTGAVTLAGTLAISNGGTGQTTRQNAMDALAGATTSGQYLRGNGTDVVMSAIQAADVPTLNQNTTGNATTATTATNQSGGTVSATSITDSGNLAFTGTGNRITGDFSNATIANAVIFQTSTTNGSTRLRVMPNGTGTDNALDLFGSTDLANSSRLSLRTSATDMALVSTREGTGTYLPMTFYTGGSERVRIDTSGNVGIGTVAALNADPSRYYLSLKGTGTTGGTGNGVLQFQTNAAGSTSPNIGNIEWSLPDNTSSSTFRVAYINVNSEGATANNRGSNLVFATKADGVSSSGAERMRIDSSGNVGIGTSSPTTKLSVVSATNAGISVNDGTVNTIIYNSTGGVSSFGTTTNHPVDFYSNNAARMRIDSSGNMGIGTSAPATKLEIAHSGGAAYGTALQVSTVGGTDDPVISLQNYNGGSPVRYGISCTDNGSLAFLSGAYTGGFGTERARIDSSGNFYVGTGTSCNLTNMRTASLAASGYQKMPNGLLMQWVAVGTTTATSGTIAFSWPVAFSSACYSALPACNSADSGEIGTTKSTSGGTLNFFGFSGISKEFIVVGIGL